jgi:hypothetical protein|tara:strand:- start:963 stop:1172 length:210 start_codon:yes stop_codon:yes gene_type:complete
MHSNKRLRQEGAIARLEKTIEAHQADFKLVNKIIEDKKLTKTSKELETLRNKKIERAQKTIENTKIAMR